VLRWAPSPSVALFSRPSVAAVHVKKSGPSWIRPVHVSSPTTDSGVIQIDDMAMTRVDNVAAVRDPVRPLRDGERRASIYAMPRTDNVAAGSDNVMTLDRTVWTLRHVMQRLLSKRPWLIECVDWLWRNVVLLTGCEMSFNDL